jgi:hypothetical protein
VHGLPRRKRKAQRVSHIQGWAVRNGEIKAESIPLEHVPDAIHLPVFDKKPSILFGQPSSGPVSSPRMRALFNRERINQRIRASNATAIYLNNGFDKNRFVRWLCKIAHGTAIAEYGFTFDPLLVDIIEGRNLEIAGALIGAEVATMFEPDHGNMHLLQTLVMTNTIDDYVVVQLRLFVNYTMSPVYSLFTGRLREPLSQRNNNTAYRPHLIGTIQFQADQVVPFRPQYI